MRRRVAAVAALVAGALVGGALVGTLPVGADLAQPAVVSADPVDWTPHVLDGSVRAIAIVGDTVVVGGDFSAVADAAGQREYGRWYLFAFDRATGEIREDFVPDVDGPVYALATGPQDTVYVGGAFGTVNGAAQRGLSRLQVADGARVPGFRAAIGWGDVRALAAYDGAVYAGGTFTAVTGLTRPGLARLDSTSGAADPSFDAGLAAERLSRVKVEDFALSPDGSRLVAIGAVTGAGGQPRAQLVMVDTRAGRTADWYTTAYQTPCRANFETYLRGVDFAPDGSYFVVVSTGRMTGPGRMCDTAARFETPGTGEHRPTWVNYTGGDSLYSVAVTGTAVYVGGHQRWMDNPQGSESAGPGAVSRTGIAAIDPVSGKALPWNPTRARGVGVRAFAAGPEGLYLGSDTDRLAHEYHARLGMFPL